MSPNLPSAMEASPRRASTLFTYLASRVVIVTLLTGADTFVFLKSAVQGLRNSIGRPAFHWLLIAALAVIVVTLGTVWYTTVCYRRPSNNSNNPFL